MTRVTTSAISKVATGDRHTLCLPPNWVPTDSGHKELVICIPGHGGTSDQCITPTYIDKINFALAEAGYPVLCIDAGYPAGQKSWGNATAMSAIASAITYGQSAAVGAKSGKVIISGVSMGALNSLTFTLLNPTLIKGVAAYIPAVGISEHYAANTGGYAVTEMNAAYSVSNQAGLDAAVAGRDPKSNTGGYSGIPIKGWCADNDTAAISSSQTSFLSAVPSATRQSLGNVGHDPTSINPAEVVTFVQSL